MFRQRLQPLLAILIIGVCLLGSAVRGATAIAPKLTQEELAWLKTHPVVRLGVDKNFPPFEFIDNRGRYRGIAADIIALAFKRVGLQKSLVYHRDWGKTLAEVKSGKVDVMSVIAPTAARKKFLNFTVPYIKFKQVFVTRKNYPPVNSLADFRGKTVAVSQGYAEIAQLKKQYPDLKQLVVKSPLEELLAVAVGKADLSVGSLGVISYLMETNNIAGLKIAGLADIQLEETAMGVTKRYPLLVSILNKALATVTQAERLAIYNKWIGGAAGKIKIEKRVDLTAAEEAWLRNHPVISVHNEQNWPPFNYVSDGKPCGLSIDYMNLLAQRLGVRVKYMTGPSWSQFLNLIREKKLDLMLNIVKTPERSKYLLFTKPYIRNPNIIVSRSDHQFKNIAQLNGHTVAIVKGFFFEEIIRKSHPKIKMLLLQDTLSCLRAVVLRQADAALGEQAAVDYVMHKNMLSNLVISGEADIGSHDLEELRIGVRNDYPLLRSALNKAMSTVTPAEMNSIQRKWLFVSEKLHRGSNINLTPEEKSWLAKHPTVRFTGDPDWMPQEAFTASGDYTGIVADYLTFIESQIPLKFKKIQVKQWSDALKLAQRRAVDVLSETVDNNARRKYLIFTKPYFRSPIVILTRNDTTNLSTPASLKGKKVILVRNYGYLDQILPLFPGIKKLYVNSVSEGILMLSRGEADAMATAQSSGSYAIDQLGITNLMIAQRPPISMELGLGVRSDWPELVSILNKVLATMTPRQHHNIQAKWVPKISSTRVDVNVHQPNPLFTLGIIVIGLILLGGLMFVIMRNFSDRLQKLHSLRVKIIGGGAMFIFLLTVIAGAWFSLQDMQLRVRNKTGEALQVITTTTYHLLKGWIDDEKNYLKQWAQTPELLQAIKEILKVPRNQKALLQSPAQQTLRQCYKNKGKREEDRGFFVIAPDNITLASSQNDAVGKINPIAQKRPAMLRRAFAGETVFIPPLLSEQPSQKQHSRLKKSMPAMFFATPILDHEKHVIAVLATQIDPIHDFSRICQLGRIGKSGESYAFDSKGYFLSESRFKDQLVKIGLLDSKNSQIAMRITDPWVNLLTGAQPKVPRQEQPLTKMVKMAIHGTSGVDVEGYRDYRGVPVLGSWIWDKDLQIGIASEIDEADALDTYYANSRIIITVLGITVLLAMALVGYTFWSGEMSKRELRSARDRWERVASEQMAAVQQRAQWAHGFHEIGRQIAVCDTVEELTETAVRASVKELNLANAWMGKFDEHGNLQPLASYGIELRSSHHATPNCQSLVLQRGEPIIQIDTRNRPPHDSCSSFAENAEFRSCATYPVYVNGSCIATFTIRAHDYGEHGMIAQTIPLLKTLVSQIGYIWERCLAEKEMRKLSSAIEQSPATVVITDSEGTIEYVNPQFSEMTGYSFEEAVGQNPRILKSPGVHPPEFYENLWRTITSGKKWRGELCNRKKNGQLFWESAAISSVKDKDGKITHYVAVKEDITELKRVRKEMEAQKVFLENTLNSLAHPFYVIDAENYNIVMMNSVARRQGVPGAKTCHKLTHNSDLPCSGDKDPCPLEKIKATKQPVIVEHVHHDNDGNEIIAEVHGYPILDDDGKVIQMIEYSLDITERKQAEIRLEEAKRLAEEATKAKGDFLANMSHEIRTPMNAIIGMNHLLSKTELNEKQRNYVNKVNRAAHNLLGIINDILDFSKIEAGKMDIENIEFELEEVMDNLANLTAGKAKEKGLEMIFDIDTDVPDKLVGDPLRLGQVLLNFVGNAVKFTEKGEIKISVELLSKTETEAELRFSVKDTGIGLTEEQQGKMFQSFSQADTTTTRKFGGTGLGLAISKRLVELMNGTIGLKSEYGVGSEFFFTVKFGLHHSNRQKMRLLAKDLRGMRLLIVDDNESTREVLQNYTEDFNFEVETVSSGLEAISEIKRIVEEGGRMFDLILIDWKMPGMNGIETVKVIKNELQLPVEPRIIMLTNYGREEVMKQAHDIELDAFLIKPVSQSMLLDTIMNVFGKTLPDIPGDNAADNELDANAITGFAGKHILLVEDNELNQEVAIGLLDEAKVTVDIANNGQEAVDILREKGENYYQAVLMDLQMPVMSGYDATQVIRDELNYRQLPIIAMSADAMVGVRERCLKAGMSDYLTKPIDPKLLFSVLGKWLGVGTVQSPAADADSEAAAELNIAGLDTAAGLARVAGNMKIYSSILKKFCTQYGDIDRQIKAAVETADFELAERLAHTVKGVAGNIAAEEVFNCSIELDKLLKQAVQEKKIADTNKFEQLLEQLRAYTNALITAIKNSSLYDDEPQSGDKKLSPEEFSSLLQRLKELLEDDDAEARSCLDELIAGSDYRELRDIAELVGDYDFEEALEELESFMAKYNITIG